MYWVEAGWDEQTDVGDKRFVYFAQQHSTGYSELRYTTGAYPLVDGNYYTFRARQDGNPGQLSAVGEVWYNGGWNALGWNHSMRCQTAGGAGNCFIQFFGEAFAYDLTWFALNAPTDGAGVNFKNTYVRTNPNTWPIFLDDDFGATEFSDAPYYICWINGGTKWSRFRVKHASGC
jgi:hypothetical protein